MNDNPFEPTGNRSGNIRPSTREIMRRLWIIGLLLSEVYWHFQLYSWVVPPPNKWDMGGIAGMLQSAIFVGFMMTLFLVFCMYHHMDTARIAMISISICAAILGLVAIMARMATGAMSSVIFYEITYVFFNFVIAVLLLRIKYFRGDIDRRVTSEG